MVGGGIARQIGYIARASALPRAVFLLLPRAVCRLAAMASGVDFTGTSRFRGNRRAQSQDGRAIPVHMLGTLVVPWKHLC